jgi:hypothetical protein
MALSVATTVDQNARAANLFGVPRPRHDYTESGTKTVSLPAIPAGSRITQASISISGDAFQGQLRFLSGAQVTISPITYNSDGVPGTPSAGEEGFIVNFNGIRSLLSLEMAAGSGLITKVLAWLGTDFSNKPLFTSEGDSSAGFSGAETSKIFVQLSVSPAIDAATFATACRIETGTFPSNVKASLSGRPPFFAQPGVLNNSIPVTGLADDLNALLAGPPSPQPMQLTLSTDTPGVILVSFDPANDFKTQQSAAAQNGGQASADFSLQSLQQQTIALTFPTTSVRSWIVNKLSLSLSGQFPPWRAFSAQSSDAPGPVGLKVNAQFSVARRVALAADTDLNGFALLLRKPAAAAQLHLEVVEDSNGQPGPGPALAAADLAVPLIDTDFQWLEAVFAVPARIPAQKQIWLAIRAKTGAVELGGLMEASSASTNTLFSNEGGAWQSYPSIGTNAPLVQTRVLRKPFATENDPLLQLALNGQQATATGAPDAANLDFTFAAGHELQVSPAGGSTTVSFGATSLASGKLTIRSARVFYQEVG